MTGATLSERIANDLVVVRMGRSARRVGRTERKFATEVRAQAAAQIVHGAIGQGDVGYSLSALGDDRRRPETGIDVNRLKAIRVPRDAHGSVAFHLAILTRPVPKGALSLLRTGRDHDRLS